MVVAVGVTTFIVGAGVGAVVVGVLVVPLGLVVLVPRGLDGLLLELTATGLLTVLTGTTV